MTFDEQHGWVEHGTRGVHGGAAIMDLDAETEALKRLAAQALHDGYWWPAWPSRARAQRLEELERHHRELADTERFYEIEALREGDTAGAHYYARKYITRKLAILAPYIAILYAGDAKRGAGAMLDHDLGPYHAYPGELTQRSCHEV